MIVFAIIVCRLVVSILILVMSQVCFCFEFLVISILLVISVISILLLLVIIILFLFILLEESSIYFSNSFVRFLFRHWILFVWRFSFHFDNFYTRLTIDSFLQIIVISIVRFVKSTIWVEISSVWVLLVVLIIWLVVEKLTIVWTLWFRFWACHLKSNVDMTVELIKKVSYDCEISWFWDISSKLSIQIVSCHSYLIVNRRHIRCFDMSK